MIRWAFPMLLAFSGQVLAAEDCNAAAARFVALMPEGPMETLEGKTFAEAVEDRDSRWFLISTSMIGAALVIDQATGDQQRRAAQTILASDLLLDCWRPADGTGTKEQLKAVAQAFELFSPEVRAELKLKAQAVT